MEKTPTFQVQAFGHYYLLERIAVGGMAEIFKAKQTGVRGFEKLLVIKKILHHLSEDPEFVEMFEDEAKIAAQLTQANIVQIFELGEVDGTLYITMEYVEGKNIRDITRNSAQRGVHLSVEQCVFLMSEVLKGLDYAHRKSDSSGVALSIVHRDMSPQNIIVSYEGEVKILDFGIAKAASKMSRTEAGVLKGKFSYMSPEQASGKMITQTTDIYACGVIFHELLTSERLFRAKTDMETLERVKDGFVLPPSDRNPLVPPELDAIVLKALAKDQNTRYQSAAEMLNDLSKLSTRKSYRYTSQDMASFMKTLFASTIAEEKRRLIDALERIPAATPDPLMNAKTHIAFKRSEARHDTEVPETKEEATFTGSRKGIPLGSKKIRKRLLLVGTIAAILILFFFRTRSPEAPVAVQESPQPISVPSEVKPSEIPQVSPEVPAPPLDPFAPETTTKGKVDEVFGKVTPPPLEEDQPAPKRNPKSKPTPKQTPAAPSPPPAQSLNAFGTLDVMAPPDGFALLFIDGKKFGTVPGPKARGISLPEGSHVIQCETTKHSYAGRIQIKADETSIVRCGELKEGE